MTIIRHGSVNDIPDSELVRRAVLTARADKRGKHSRWVAIMHTFSLGSGYSMELCRRFGFDPDELVSR